MLNLSGPTSWMSRTGPVQGLDPVQGMIWRNGMILNAVSGLAQPCVLTRPCVPGSASRYAGGTWCIGQGHPDCRAPHRSGDLVAGQWCQHGLDHLIVMTWIN